MAELPGGPPLCPDGPVSRRAISAPRAGTAAGTSEAIMLPTRSAHTSLSFAPGSMCPPSLSNVYINVITLAVDDLSPLLCIAAASSARCFRLAATTVGPTQ